MSGRAGLGRAEGGRWTRLARAPPAPPTELAPVFPRAPGTLLSFDFFVKCKTHIQVLSPEAPLGTGVVTLRMSAVGGISQLAVFIRRMVVFPGSRILWWAFIDRGCPEYLGPTSPDLHVHGSLKNKAFYQTDPSKVQGWNPESFTCQSDALSLSRTPSSKRFPIKSYKGENFCVIIFLWSNSDESRTFP